MFGWLFPSKRLANDVDELKHVVKKLDLKYDELKEDYHQLRKDYGLVKSELKKVSNTCDTLMKFFYEIKHGKKTLVFEEDTNE